MEAAKFCWIRAAALREPELYSVSSCSHTQVYYVDDSENDLKLFQ